PTDLRVHSAAHRAELTALGLQIASSSGTPRQVFEWAERGRASRLGHRPARPPDDPLLADLLGQLRGVAFETARPDAAGLAALIRQQSALERRIRDHTRLRRGGSTGPGAPVALPVLKTALGERALVEFFQI